MKKPRILLVSYHFYPSPEVGAKRPSETAIHLAGQGYDVTVLRAMEREHLERADPAELSDLKVISVKVPRRLFTAAWIALKGALKGRNRGMPSPAAERVAQSAPGSARRRRSPMAWLHRQLLAYDTLFQGNKRWLLLSVLKLLPRIGFKGFDLVIASGPPMVSYICGWAAAKLAGAKLVLDYRDPWYLHGDPELSTVMLGHPLARFENGLATTCARSSLALVAASPGTRQHILSKFGVAEKDVHVIRNGFDRHAVVTTPPPAGRLDFLYAGSLYWNRNPFPFLEGLKRALGSDEIDRAKVRFRLYGRCEQWNKIPLAPWITANEMQDVVEIFPMISPEELNHVVARSNVMINFAQGQRRQIPAKSYDLMASRRDVLVITELDGDVAELFREARIGTIVEPHDVDGFQKAVRSMYVRHVLGEGSGSVSSTNIDRYSRAAQLQRYGELVAAVLDTPPRHDEAPGKRA